jgi:hypothetical protein
MYFIELSLFFEHFHSFCLVGNKSFFNSWLIKKKFVKIVLKIKKKKI